MSRSANYAATGMRAAAAKKQSMDRSPVLSEVRKRPEREHLIEAHLTMKNVAAGDAELALDVERRQDVDMFYGARKSRSVLIDYIEHAPRKRHPDNGI